MESFDQTIHQFNKKMDEEKEIEKKSLKQIGEGDDEDINIH